MARCGLVQTKGHGTRSKRFGENVKKLAHERNRLKMEKPTKKMVTNEITVVRPNNFVFLLLIQMACQGIATQKERALWRPVWNKLKTRLMLKWRTTVVDPRNLEADNKSVVVTSSSNEDTQTQRQVPNSHNSQVAWEQLP